MQSHHAVKHTAPRSVSTILRSPTTPPPTSLQVTQMLNQSFPFRHCFSSFTVCIGWFLSLYLPSKLFLSVQLFHYQRSIVMSLSGFSSRFFHPTSQLRTCRLGFPAGYTRFLSSSSCSSAMHTSRRLHSYRACPGCSPPHNASQSPSSFLSNSSCIALTLFHQPDSLPCSALSLC